MPWPLSIVLSNSELWVLAGIETPHGVGSGSALTRQVQALVSALGCCGRETWHSSWAPGLVEALGLVGTPDPATALRTGAELRPGPGCVLLTRTPSFLTSDPQPSSGHREQPEIGRPRASGTAPALPCLTHKMWPALVLACLSSLSLSGRLVASQDPGE